MIGGLRRLLEEARREMGRHTAENAKPRRGDLGGSCPEHFVATRPTPRLGPNPVTNVATPPITEMCAVELCRQLCSEGSAVGVSQRSRDRGGICHGMQTSAVVHPGGGARLKRDGVGAGGTQLVRWILGQ